ncbi:MAG: hypothetical protein MUO76_19180 [Anaerolineaceae bacterium]|nr:hypothetical protein [Anaerolineaceae bacterium]
MIKKERCQKNNPVDVGAKFNAKETEPQKTIFIVDDDLYQINEIASQINHFGYEIKAFT